MLLSPKIAYTALFRLVAASVGIGHVQGRPLSAGLGLAVMSVSPHFTDNTESTKRRRGEWRVGKCEIRAEYKPQSGPAPCCTCAVRLTNTPFLHDYTICHWSLLSLSLFSDFHTRIYFLVILMPYRPTKRVKNTTLVRRTRPRTDDGPTEFRHTTKQVTTTYSRGQLHEVEASTDSRIRAAISGNVMSPTHAICHV